MADRGWDSDSDDVDVRMDPNEELGVNAIHEFIRLIGFDVGDRLHRLSVRVFRSVPSNHLAPVASAFLALDPTVLDPLPNDADLAHMRQHLETLKALSRKVSRWEKRVDEVPDLQPADPSLQTLREVRAGMQSDLTRRYVRLSTICQRLDTTQRGHVFEMSPHLRDINVSTLIPCVDQLDVLQMREHLEVLKTLSRHLRVCEQRLDEINAASRQ